MLEKQRDSFALLVCPGRPTLQQLLNNLRNLRYFFRRLALVSAVNDRSKPQPSPVEWPLNVETLSRVLRTRREPVVVEDFRSEGANIRMQAPAFRQEQSLIVTNRCFAMKQV